MIMLESSLTLSCQYKYPFEFYLWIRYVYLSILALSLPGKPFFSKHFAVALKACFAVQHQGMQWRDALNPVLNIMQCLQRVIWDMYGEKRSVQACNPSSDKEKWLTGPITCIMMMVFPNTVEVRVSPG